MLARAELGFARRNADGEKCFDLLVAKLGLFVERSEPFFDLSAFKESIGRAFAARMSASVSDASLQNSCVYCDRQIESAELFQANQPHKSHAKRSPNQTL
jgi:hypothetical protein